MHHNHSIKWMAVLVLGITILQHSAAAQPKFEQAPSESGPEHAQPVVSITKGRELPVSLGPNASPAEKRAAELLIDAVRQRTGIELSTGNPAPGSHALVLGTAQSHPLVRDYLARRNDAGKLSTDGFVVAWEPGEKRWYVAGQSPSGAVAGVGRLLRGIRFEQGRLSLPAARFSDAPAMPIRGIYLWAREPYFKSKNLDRYIEEFALWGGNSLALWFELGMFSSFEDPQAQHWREAYRRCFETAQRVGMKTTLILVANDAYQSSAKQFRISPIIGCPGHYLCPSKPEGARQLLAWQDQLIKSFSHLDGLIIFPADPGGCSCADCTPWPTEGFWRAARPLGERFHERFPEADVWVAFWHLHHPIFGGENWQQLVKLLGGHRPAWLTGIQPGMAPHHPFAKVTPAEQQIYADAGLPLSLFPEVSMYRNHGGMLVKKGYWEQMRAEMTRYPAGQMRGGWPYSERWNTDIANVAFLCWFWNPQKTVDAVLDEYASWYFGPSAPEARQLLQLLDDGNRAPDREAKVREVFAKLDRQLPGWAREDWRWKEIATSAARLEAGK
jgi:hypothetical protein